MVDDDVLSHQRTRPDQSAATASQPHNPLSHPAQWLRHVRHPRGLLFLVAFLTATSGIGLSASLRFPEVLLDHRSFAISLATSHPVIAVMSLIGLLAGGLLLAVASRALAPSLPEGRRRAVLVVGAAAGLCWGGGATLGLILVPLWASDLAAGVSVLSGIAFVSAALAAPLLLVAWTGILVRQVRGARVLGVLGMLGLLLIVGRSSVWWINALLPEDEGFYLASAVLTLLALLGYPLWACWLIRTGVLVTGPGKVSGDVSVPPWHRVRAVGKRLGVGLLGAAFVLTHAGLTTAITPTPKSDHVPTVPSAGGAALYATMLALSEKISPPSTYSQLLTERQDDHDTQLEVPQGATLENIDAGGVPADYICAEGASNDRAALYLHGGGFNMPTSNGHRGLAAAVSGATGACVLLPDYRVAPEAPFPAAVQDGVNAYRWLRQQGIAASQIAIFGDSAGGNLTLTTALSLRDSGDALPAALVSISPITDLTLSGETHRTKAGSEAMLLRDSVDYAVRGYTGNGTADPRDPLISPLFADPEGLPPTLLMAGSQEVLLSDSTRMADRLRAADVPVKLEIWPGMPHGWHIAAEGLMEYELARQHIATFISRHFAGEPQD